MEGSSQVSGAKHFQNFPVGLDPLGSLYAVLKMFVLYRKPEMLS